MNENFARFFLVVSGNMCKNSFKTHVLLLSLNTAIKHMARNVTQMPFCSQVPFLLYADWNKETYGEYVDCHLYSQTHLPRDRHTFILLSDIELMLKIMARDSYITKVISSTSDVP